MAVWKWSGESRYPGALTPIPENFCPSFSAGATDCPWVFEDEVTNACTKILAFSILRNFLILEIDLIVLKADLLTNTRHDKRQEVTYYASLNQEFTQPRSQVLCPTHLSLARARSVGAGRREPWDRG